MVLAIECSNKLNVYMKLFKLIIFSFCFAPLLIMSQNDKNFLEKYNKATEFDKLDNADSAFGYYTEVTEFKKNSVSDSLHKKLCQSYLKAAKIAFDKGDLKTATKHIINCISLSTERKDTLMLIKAHKSNADIYREIKNFDAASIEVREAIHLALITKKTNYLLYSAYITLSTIFIEGQHRVDSSIYFLEKAIPLVTAAGDSSTLAQCYNNMAVNLQRQQKYSKAILFYKQALSIHLLKGNRYPILLCNSNIAQAMCDSKNYSEAIKQAIYTLGLFNSDEHPSVRTDIHLSMARSYLHLNQPDSAEKYFEKFFEGTIMSFQNEQNKTINELNTKYKTEEREKDISILKKNSELQDEEAKRKQIIIYFFVGLSLLLAISVYLAVKSYFTKKKANLVITQQKHLVEEKQKEIIDSINYAKRIQFALLPPAEFLKKNLNEHFVLFKPKDIVSGDFYWATKKEYGFYLAVCDSTGHGVPGAFVSLMNISFLNEAINEKNIHEPNKVLDHVRERLIKNMDGQDGMDATLVRFEKDKITYASAHNKPVHIRNNAFVEMKADKMPVGKGERTESFNLYTIEHQKGDCIYFYTDGFADQFGGPKGKKFKYKQLEEILLKNHKLPINEQSQALEKAFEVWKGQLEQVDDVCIIGIRL